MSVLLIADTLRNLLLIATYYLSVSPQGLQSENDALKKTLDKVQSQLDTSLDAQDQQRKVKDSTTTSNDDAEP